MLRYKPKQLDIDLLILLLRLKILRHRNIRLNLSAYINTQYSLMSYITGISFIITTSVRIFFFTLTAKKDTKQAFKSID